MSLLNTPLSEISQVKAEVMIHSLHGAMDAGRAGRLLVDTLIDSLPSKTIAAFDSDKLIDYRSHRPWLSFEDWAFQEIAFPQISIDLVQDDFNRNVLVLHGPEPDSRWMEFYLTLREVVKACGVKQVVSVMGMPAGVPHTRPTPVHYHGSRPDLLPPQPKMAGELLVPAGMDQFLSYSFNVDEIDALGVVAAVPYYLSEGDYPPGAVALARAVSELTGLGLPIGDLEAASSKALSQVEELISESNEASNLIQILEQHFDAAAEGLMLPEDEEDLPTADEIGARLEEFLEQNERNRGHRLGDFGDGVTTNPSLQNLKNFGNTPYQRRNIDRLPRPPRGRHRAEEPGDQA